MHDTTKESITGEVTSAVINDNNKEEKGRIQIPPLEIRLSLSLSLSLFQKVAPQW
jgi:hypothetical protein